MVKNNFFILLQEINSIKKVDIVKAECFLVDYLNVNDWVFIKLKDFIVNGKGVIVL